MVVGAVVCGAVTLTVVVAAVVAVVDVISVFDWVSTVFEFGSQPERATIAAPTAIVSEITLIISLLFKDISSTPKKSVHFCALIFSLYCNKNYLSTNISTFLHTSQKNVPNALIIIPKSAPLCAFSQKQSKCNNRSHPPATKPQ